MNKLLTAIALTIALPAAAYAADPAPQPKQDCCQKMKAEGKDCCCCKDMGKDHAGHDSPKGEHEAHQH